MPFTGAYDGEMALKASDLRYLALAETQYGVVSRVQLLALDVTEHQIDGRVRNGRLVRMFSGVYRIAGSPATGRQRAFAATLWLGDEAVVSHLTGAVLLRFDGCKTSSLHVSVPNSVRKRAGEEITIHRVNALPLIDRVTVDGIACTSATRTLIDCAGLLDAEGLEVAFESARRMGLTSVRFLSKRLDELGGSGRRGSTAVRQLLSHQREDERALQYALEVKTARLLRGSELPRFKRQVQLGRYRIDFALPLLRRGVECEGFEYHGSRLRWKRDKQRTAWIEAQGWRLTFVSWDDVTKRPEQTLHRIALALSEVVQR